MYSKQFSTPLNQAQQDLEISMPTSQGTGFTLCLMHTFSASLKRSLPTVLRGRRCCLVKNLEWNVSFLAVLNLSHPTSSLIQFKMLFANSNEILNKQEHE